MGKGQPLVLGDTVHRPSGWRVQVSTALVFKLLKADEKRERRLGFRPEGVRPTTHGRVLAHGYSNVVRVDGAGWKAGLRSLMQGGEIGPHDEEPKGAEFSAR